MKKFGNVRGIDDLERKADLDGWEIDTSDYYEKGSDFLFLSKKEISVAFNTFNGRFFIINNETKNFIGTDQSISLKKEVWYKEILKIVYKEIPERFKTKKESSRQLNPLKS